MGRVVCARLRGRTSSLLVWFCLSCASGLHNSITAITFVALGTSLPDTFASMTACRDSPYADDCIGNITGSNAVNVFLGIGLPWFIASIYWRVQGPTDEWKQRYVQCCEVSIPRDSLEGV